MVLSVSDHFLDVRVKKDYSKIDWAFAGVKRIESDGKCIWTHEIDSRGWTDEDSGYIRAINERDELESGSMKNPDNHNKIMAHEEVWRNLETLDRGYIAKKVHGSEWFAVVDRHVLRLHCESDQFSVARFEKNVATSHWTTVYAVGPWQFESMHDELIQGVFDSESWSILTSQDFTTSR